jgi:tetratricopeptide (TPR) repeat protein
MIARDLNVISILLMCTLLAGLAGCSGSSDDPAATLPVATRLIAGTVEDGPIAGAQVRLLDRAGMNQVYACGASGLGLCSQIFDNPDGHFSFVLAMDVDPATLLVETTGGVDQASRVDFSRSGFSSTPLRMLAPLDRYLDRIDQVSVNPLTTLAVLSDRTATAPLSVSLQLLTGLGLTNEESIFASPAETAETQRLTLLLSKLAILSSSDDPFAVVTDYLLAGQQLLDETGQLMALELESAGVLTAEQIAELQALQDVLLNVTDPDQMSTRFRQQEIIQGFLAALTDPANSVLPEPNLLDTVDPDMQLNLQTLADMVLNAVGDQLLLGGAVPEHLARFVLFSYGLEDQVKLAAAPQVFNSYLTRTEADDTVVTLDMDPALLGLANLQVSQSISVPLPASGLLTGDDLTLSSQKRNYYYQSDISHLYQAKQLVWNINDDPVNDAVLLQVVEGEAIAGRFIEAATLLRTQIYQSEVRGQAYIKYAEGLTAHGFRVDALVALQEAEALFLKVVDAKGIASFSRADAQNFKDLARGYIEAGYPNEALAIVQFLAADVAGYLTATTAYGNLTTAGREVVAAFVELGDMVNAETALNLTYQLTLGVPDDSNGTAKYRVRELVAVAELFAELGYLPRVEDVWTSIEQLRYADNLITETGTATESYIPKLAVAIYTAGMVSETFELIASLPVGAGVFERYQMEAYKRLATHLAIRDQGLGAERESLPVDPANYTAMDLINFFLVPDYFNPTVADSQIEALTYYNSAVAYVALAMIEKNLTSEATVALVKAEQIVDTLDPNGVKLRSNAKVNYGYAKLAELYLKFEATVEAKRLLDKGVAVLPLIDDPTYHAKAVALLAELYLDLGDFARASSLLSLIGEAVDLDGYVRVIKAYTRIGDIQSALDFIAEYADAAEAAYDPLTMDNTSLGAASAANLVYAARFYSGLGYFSEAVETLQRALPVAWDIPTETTRMARLIDIAEELATARAYRQALELAWSLPFVSNRNAALQAIAETLATRDDFPESPYATIDLDGDRLPEFFSADASGNDILASGLSLDRDSDNDGVADDQDRWPFYGPLPSQP